MEDLKGIFKQLSDAFDKLKKDADTGSVTEDTVKKIEDAQDILDSIKASEYLGITSDEEKVYIIEHDSDGMEWLIHSSDGVNFDQNARFPKKDYKGERFYYRPHKVKNWNNAAREDLNQRIDKFDHAPITVIGEFETPKGLLVIYDCSYIIPGHQRFVGGGMLLSKFIEGKVEWRSNDPLWDEMTVDLEKKYHPLGIAYFNDQIFIYYNRGKDIHTVTIANPFDEISQEISKAKVKKYLHNPILSPKEENKWEGMATFNPATVTIDDTVHMFYRAQGHDHLSVVGYAKSEDGYSFDRADEPAYVPEVDFSTIINKMPPDDPRRISGGGWGGCEDPRATVIDDKVHLIYVAFDGWSEPRLAMSTIHVDDVTNQNWDKWSDPVFLTPWSNVWGTGNKSGVLFPEKINDKYYFMHRLWPNICIDWVDDSEFGHANKYLQTKSEIKVRRDYWDSTKIGAGAPPIKTDDGWLLIYFGVGYQDPSKYKIGAMMLDAEDPTIVTARSSSPIISPDEWYENNGKPGVAYPCGAVVKDGELIVYYGGADAVVCAASSELDEFVYNLKKDKVDSQVLKEVYVHS